MSIRIAETPVSMYKLLNKADINKNGFIDTDKEGEKMVRAIFAEKEERVMLPEKMTPEQISNVEQQLLAGLRMTKYATPAVADMQGKLIVAIQRGDKDVLERITKENCNTVDSTGLSPLIAAAYSGRDEVISKLISLGVNLDKTDKWGQTALIVAVFINNTSTAKLLINAGAKLDIKDEDHNSAILGAVKSNNLELIKSLVGKGANIELTHSTGITPLLCACFEGKDESAKLLLDLGANIEKSNSNKLTPLTVAAMQNKTNIVNLLIERNAKIDSLDNQNQTALRRSVNANHYEATEILVKAKANLNLQGEDGLTPLMTAANGGNNKIAQLLINAKAKLEIVDTMGQTALTYAVRGKHDEIAKVLINAKANVNNKDVSGTSILATATLNSSDEVFQELINAGADVNFRAPSAEEALVGVEKMVKELAKTHPTEAEQLKNQIVKSIKEQVDNGNSNLLQITIAMRNINKTKALIKAGADINAKNNVGATPLLCAVTLGYNELIGLLLDSGADFSIKDKAGKGIGEYITKPETREYIKTWVEQQKSKNKELK